MFTFMHMAAALTASRGSNLDGKDLDDDNKNETPDESTNLNEDIRQYNQDISVSPGNNDGTNADSNSDRASSYKEYNVDNSHHKLEDCALHGHTFETENLHSLESPKRFSSKSYIHRAQDIIHTVNDLSGSVTNSDADVTEHSELEVLQEFLTRYINVDELKDDTDIQWDRKNNEINLDNAKNENICLDKKDNETTIVEEIVTTHACNADNDIAVYYMPPERHVEQDIPIHKVDTKELTIFEHNISKEKSDHNITDVNKGKDPAIQSINENDCSTQNNANFEQTLDYSGEQENIMMPETHDEIDGALSPSPMFASCRYRWEKTILTQSQSVVFVTLNKKGLEPVPLNWSESEKCFSSDEFKIPVGIHIGNLIIDGTFYPVDDVAVKHYTFIVDLYLKEDGGHGPGLAQEAQFLKQNHKNGQPEVEINPNNHTGQPITETLMNRNNCTPATSNYYTYPVTRARMEKESAQFDGRIDLSSKYKELVRSQMSCSRGTPSDNESVTERESCIQSEFPDLDGRRTPVGEDKPKQYQDGDDNDFKSSESGLTYNSTKAFNEQNHCKDSFQDDCTDKINFHSSSSILSGSFSNGYTTPPTVIDGVLGIRHTKIPIYSTESLTHSKSNSTHSSARQMAIAFETEDMARFDSIGSATLMHLGNSANSHVMDDLINDVKNYDRQFPALETQTNNVYTSPKSTSITTMTEPLNFSHPHGFPDKQTINELIEDAFGGRSPFWAHSQKDTPNKSQLYIPTTAPEQISNVFNPADRHSLMQRDISIVSPKITNNSAHSSSQLPSSTSHTSSRNQTPGNFGSHASPVNLSSRRDYCTSQNGSRAESVTSEQELSQFNASLPSENDNKPSVNAYVSSTSSRVFNVSTFPVGMSLNNAASKHSTTPDNQNLLPVVPAGPIVKGSLLHNRSPARPHTSNASSRTVARVSTEPVVGLIEQIKDLENTVSNLRKILSLREEQDGDLQKQLSEKEKKYQDICNEKEFLNSEIVRLKGELKRKNEPSLNSYNPNSTAALQRKIDDLNSHIQDLQEANEAAVEESRVAVEECRTAEKKVKDLASDNEALRIRQSEKFIELEDDNRHLKSEIQCLKESHICHTDVSDCHLRVALQQIKDDSRSLRERNFLLHDDNLRLREELSNLRKSVEMVDMFKRSLRDNSLLMSDIYNKNVQKDKLLESSYIKGDSYMGCKTSNVGHVGSHKSDIGPVGSRTSEIAHVGSRTSDISHVGSRHTSDIGNVGNRTYDIDPVGSRTSDISHVGCRTSNIGYVDSRTSGHVASRTSDVGYTSSRTSDADINFEKYNCSGLGYEADKKYSKDGHTSRREPDLETERILTSGSSRYERYRTKLEGQSAEKYVSPPAYTQHLTTEIPSSAVKSSKNEMPDLRRMDRNNDIDHPWVSVERIRTSSTELDFKSIPFTTYDKELPDTTPALSGRSRAIYKKLSKLRSKSHTERRQTCENDDNNHASSQPYNSSQSPRKHQNQTDRYQMPDGNKKSVLEKVEDIYSRQDLSNQHLRHPPGRDIKVADLTTSVKRYMLPYQDDGNTSDTPTDILVSTQPIGKGHSSSSWNRGHQRLSSLGSEDSNTSFSNIDDEITAATRKRSKSADCREILRRFGQNDSLQTTQKSEKLRSLTPSCLMKQSTKSGLSFSSSLNSLTQGLRPFAPRSTGDLKVNDIIKFSGQGGKLSQGTIKYIGHLPGCDDIHLGVELDKEDGKHDGVFGGIQYFKCKPNKGVFVAYNKVVMAWSSY